MVTEKHEWIEAALTRYERPLVSYTQRITGDLERARDVVQDAFTRLCAQEPGKLDGRLAPWLYTVCRNRALDVVKKDGRMALLEDRKAEAYPSNVAGRPTRSLPAQISRRPHLPRDRPGHGQIPRHGEHPNFFRLKHPTAKTWDHARHGPGGLIR